MLLVCLDELEPGKVVGCDPHEHGSRALTFELIDEETVRIESGLAWTADGMHLPAVDVSLADLRAAVQRLLDRVRDLLVAEFPDLREHHQLGPWLQGERQAPSEADRDAWQHPGRPRPLLLGAIPAIPRSMGRPIAVTGSQIELAFAVDLLSLAEDRAADPTRAPWQDLGMNYFEIPIRLRVAGRDLFLAECQGVALPEGVEPLPDDPSRVPWVHAPLVNAGAWGRYTARVGRQIVHARQTYRLPPPDDWSHKFHDAGHRNVLETWVEDEAMLLRSFITGEAFTVPIDEFLEAWDIFGRETLEFIQEAFPEVRGLPTWNLAVEMYG